MYEMLTYIISGFTAAFAAIVLTAKLNAAQPTAGMNYELDAVAAVVIGGTLTGGVGSIWGTLLGAIVIGVIRNGLNLLNANSYLQQGIMDVLSSGGAAGRGEERIVKIIRVSCRMAKIYKKHDVKGGF